MADTPLDPTYKKGFYLDQTAIVGRVRARLENIPDNHVDFLDINEQGRLEVVLNREAMAMLQSIDEGIKALNQTLMERLR